MEDHIFPWVNQLDMAIFNSKLLVYQRVWDIRSEPVLAWMSDVILLSWV